MDKRSETLLEGLLETHEFDDFLSGLAVVIHRRAFKPEFAKNESKQWLKVTDRILKLKEWCAEFGPGSGVK